MKYKFLEHTADAKFQAFGKSLEEKFSNAAVAMADVMVDVKKVKSKIEKKVKAEGVDTKSLLYNFLEQFLILRDSEGFILAEVKSIKIDGNKLEAVVVGDDIKNCEPKNDVKAVTYAEMEITDDYVQVVVDI